MSWVRRVNLSDRQRRCVNCDGIIDREEIYFLASTGERFCLDCEPDEESEL